jgi:hypothetical protein
MQRRQITLEDGRYLVFYTFEEETASSSASVTEETAGDGDSSARAEDARPEPQATEEQSV